MIKIWKYALGSFSDDQTKEYDNYVLIVRTFIFITYFITNCFIISGVIRHWNANEKTTDCNRTSRIGESSIRSTLFDAPERDGLGEFT